MIIDLRQFIETERKIWDELSQRIQRLETDPNASLSVADAERIRLALSLRLLGLPAPASRLCLRVERFGPVPGEQGVLGPQSTSSAGGRDETRAEQAARLREALAQVHALAGAQAALRAVCVDPDSRVPERRVVLTPVVEWASAH